MNAQEQLADLRRRIDNLLRLGTVAEVRAGECRVKTGSITTAWRPFFTTRAGTARTSWRPTVGEQVMLLSLSGDLANAYVLPALYQNAMPEPDDHPERDRTIYPDGTVVEYDPEVHQLSVNNGPANIIANQEQIKLQLGGSLIDMTNDQITINSGRINIG